MRNERGSLSAFVVSMTTGCLALVAFVHDSGRSLAHYVTVADAAQNAARIGAQSIVDIRAGNPRIDSDAAIARAQKYLHDSGLSGSVQTDHQTVTVRVERTMSLTLLGVFGVGSQKIRVTRSAVVIGG